MNTRASQRLVAVGYGLATHGLFGLAVTAMVAGLATGMGTGFGTLHGPAAWTANALLALQFPVLHSLFLAARGREWLGRLAPRGLRRDLATTLFALFASVQVLATFALWSPSGEVWYAPHGGLRGASLTLYAASWLLVMKSMQDAGLALQSGALGWMAVVRGQRPKYPPLPTRGLFAHWRQPIYTSFASALMTAPIWTPDRALLVAVWGAYCLIGPRLKEQRFLSVHGAAFARYQASHPYWLPRIKSPIAPLLGARAGRRA
ncbi:MAG: isoprenylcysteine carboxylmethyltransferase family protein [Planctomycetota bacterium]